MTSAHISVTPQAGAVPFPAIVDADARTLPSPPLTPEIPLSMMEAPRTVTPVLEKIPD